MISMIVTDKYTVNTDYEGTKQRIQKIPKDDIGSIRFYEDDQEIHFQTILPIIPEKNQKKSVLLLLRNPHPYVIKKGEYFPGDKNDPQHPFWDMLRATGCFNFKGSVNNDTLLKNQYDSPFRFIIAYYISFPLTSFEKFHDIFPKNEIKEIFDIKKLELTEFINKNEIRHVICFEDIQFNSISDLRHTNDNYQQMIKKGDIPYSTVPLKKDLKVYLTSRATKEYIKNNKKKSTDRLKYIFDKIRGNEQNSGTSSLHLKKLKSEELGECNDLGLNQKAWFVVHHRDLFDQNPHLIGFRDPDEWKKITQGDIIVYYQTRQEKIRGLFEVIKSGVHLDPTFGHGKFSQDELKNQHELKQINKWDFNFYQDKASRLSFFRFLKNPRRWDGKHVFTLNNEDMKYILLWSKF